MGEIQRRLRYTKSRGELVFLPYQSHGRIRDKILAAHQQVLVLRLLTEHQQAFDQGRDIDRLRSTHALTNSPSSRVFGCLTAAIIGRAAPAKTMRKTFFILSQDTQLLRQFSAYLERLWASLDRR